MPACVLYSACLPLCPCSFFLLNSVNHIHVSFDYANVLDCLLISLSCTYSRNFGLLRYFFSLSTSLHFFMICFLERIRPKRFLWNSETVCILRHWYTWRWNLLQKKTQESINNRLALVVKSGKFTLGYKSTLKSLRGGKGMDLFTIIQLSLTLVLAQFMCPIYMLNLWIQLFYAEFFCWIYVTLCLVPNFWNPIVLYSNLCSSIVCTKML